MTGLARVSVRILLLDEIASVICSFCPTYKCPSLSVPVKETTNIPF